MKVYVHKRGIILTGKAWEVREKLKQYSRQYVLVKDWVESQNNIK
ncbi:MULTISPECIES: Z-ring formation inhibitor MciZ [Cytobacillus]|uniref:Z-ring formation inhibitor MciZ n=1 Tax=Cytobacillus pseudoceanisediminis TaxID=3051614 RepID=A0ABZ2ZE08_9BACI|nr:MULTISPECIES: Z-ring formation inhibitor MciZ [Cytobacillus]MBY0154622.1 Z-ring formation inhibitor MciZ [Cytobacillus firmus]MBU8731411.1 Z-ring formation inhibitor MciZ [Cytobacillus oceanisediminis]MCM3243682.1 Z-ring formation inhibitor MciZ [Cytobacillus oceanisediminis]MCM3393841.1 Z-ring formation inhibitor MciZ [Cytobacillus oceanisediminis]MCM3405011.1 Z-ring formation inhibitor MciZ [Cytobacillus oceanisediminis]